MTNYELLQLSESISRDQYVGVLVHDLATGTHRSLRIQGITRHPPCRNAKEDQSNWLVSFSVSEDDSTIPPEQMGDAAIPVFLAQMQADAKADSLVPGVTEDSTVTTAAVAPVPLSTEESTTEQPQAEPDMEPDHPLPVESTSRRRKK